MAAPNPAWTYSDWITYIPGNSTRLSRLRLHIVEVSDRISTGDSATDRESHSYSYLKDYLSKLHESLLREEAISSDASPFTRGRPTCP